jgi:TRAP-type C4-dicarboxylate transport system substrate-binding protein
MNIVKQTSVLYTLGGMIYLNIFFRFMNYKIMDDNWMLIYYMLLNFLWIDFLRVSTKKIIREAIEEAEQNSRLEQ